MRRLVFKSVEASQNRDRAELAEMRAHGITSLQHLESFVVEDAKRLRAIADSRGSGSFYDPPVKLELVNEISVRSAKRKQEFLDACPEEFTRDDLIKSFSGSLARVTVCTTLRSLFMMKLLAVVGTRPVQGHKRPHLVYRKTHASLPARERRTAPPLLSELPDEFCAAHVKEAKPEISNSDVAIFIRACLKTKSVEILERRTVPTPQLRGGQVLYRKLV